MKSILKTIEKNNITNIILALVGFLLLLIPGECVKLLTILLGALLLGLSVFLFYKFIFSKANNTAMLILAILAFFIGSSFLINSTRLASIILTFIGLWVMGKGFTKMFVGKYTDNVTFLVLGLVYIVIGITMLIKPFTSATVVLRIVGFILAVSSLTDILSGKIIEKDEKPKKEKKENKSKIKSTKNVKDAQELDFVEKKK